MATTEGALVASINRGCSVVNDAGGATARVTKSGMTRAPIFRVADVAEAEALVSWVRDNEGVLREAAESTTSHGELLDVTPYVVGNNVYLRFRYDTKDAMGMNMVTIATREACDEIEAETDASLVAPRGTSVRTRSRPRSTRSRGADAPWPPTWRFPRGRRGAAPHDAGVDRGDQHRKNLVGSAKAGGLGFNAHVANAVAAMFLATGQDEAQVVEGRTRSRPRRRRPRATCTSVSLASLEVGTVGGGTGLPTQAAGLDILGVRGGGDPAGSNGDALAEAIAVARSPASFRCSRRSAPDTSSAHADLGR